MTVEPADVSNRQVVPITWDQSKLDGEVVVLHCVNSETGGVSDSGVSKNDGTGVISYPVGYAGITHVTVVDNHGNTDTGFIEVDGQGNATTPEAPDPPPDAVPPEAPNPDDPHPAHPIVEIEG
jgi:hypothetical protein